MTFQSLLPQFEAEGLHALEELSFKIFENLRAEIEPMKKMLNPQECEEKFLPFLAYENAVEFWGDNLSIQEKRNLIAAVKYLKRKKGTVYAVEYVLSQLNISATITEWFDNEADAYHFKIDIDSIGVNYDLVSLEKYVNIYKNVRSVLDSINVTASIDAANVFVGSSTSSAEIISLEVEEVQVGEKSTVVTYKDGSTVVYKDGSVAFYKDEEGEV